MAQCEFCDNPADCLVAAGGIAVCDDCRDAVDEEADAELAADQLLERQELEDFEQTDEYFGCFDGGGDW